MGLEASVLTSNRRRVGQKARLSLSQYLLSIANQLSCDFILVISGNLGLICMFRIEIR